MSVYPYPATLVPHPLHEGRYDVTFVDFPGCVTYGDTLMEALRRAEEALHMHAKGLLADGGSLPEPSSPQAAREADEREAVEEGDPLPAGTLWQLVLCNPQGHPSGRVVEQKADAPVRLSISLRPSVIERLDAIASDLGMTRSGVINLAAREYIDRQIGV